MPQGMVSELWGGPARLQSRVDEQPGRNKPKHPHIVGHDRCQMLVLPESLEDYVGPDNPVRFIEAFVEGLDLATAGFTRVTPKLTGRPGC
jgi:hypothetical protein